MEVILTQDVDKLGYKDDVVIVKDGFARNFLFPQKMALLATESAKKVLAENLKQRAFKEAKIKDEAIKLAAQLETLAVKIGAKAGATGKIYGSVNSLQIADAIKKQFNFDVDRKKIIVDGDGIKELGSYTAKVRLHKEVRIELKFEVVAE